MDNIEYLKDKAFKLALEKVEATLDTGDIDHLKHKVFKLTIEMAAETLKSLDTEDQVHAFIRNMA